MNNVINKIVLLIINVFVVAITGCVTVKSINITREHYSESNIDRTTAVRALKDMGFLKDSGPNCTGLEVKRPYESAKWYSICSVDEASFNYRELFRIVDRREALGYVSIRDGFRYREYYHFESGPIGTGYFADIKKITMITHYCMGATSAHIRLDWKKGKEGFTIWLFFNNMDECTKLLPALLVLCQNVD